MTSPDPYDGIPTYEPDPDFVGDDYSEPLPNVPDPKTGLRE